MKRTLQSILIALAVSQSVSTALAQTTVTGPNAAASPYVLPLIPGYTITSVLNASTAIGNYTMAGLPDGLGAFDNNDGTFTVLMNHEFGTAATGAIHAFGSAGSFVSKWVINKTTLAVVSGTDLTQNVYLYNSPANTYSLYNSANSSTLAGCGRFCSADLAPVSAYYNSYTGMGTQERIFMNGEEVGDEGRMMAHIATGPNAGSTYQLPFLGRFSAENQVANPRRSDKTIVAGFDDTTPGQVYIYVGNKTAAGNEITKAGLTGGQLYGVAVSGMILESNSTFAPANTTFSLINLGAGIQNLSGASLQSLSMTMGVSQFLRPEDGAWDPSHPNDLYFNTTNAFNSPSRVWRLRFTDIENPQLGGTITAVLDGTEGQQMFDNMTIDNSGHILLNEDVGNNAHLGRIFEYNIQTDALTAIGQHDANRFLSTGTNTLTQDEEASGILDVQAVLGAGKFLFVSQAHYAIASPVVEGGQLLMLQSAVTASSNPEINLQGNAVNIPAGNTGVTVGNNTDFGMMNINTFQSKTFNIQNTGTGPLWISAINISGVNAGDFVILNPPAFPLTIAPNGSQVITVKFTPAVQGTRSATVNLVNNDFNESLYDFAVQGVGAVQEINIQGNSSSIPDGNNSVSTSNDTDFGTAITNNTLTKTFAIQNTGNGTLTVSGITISGANAGLFTMVSPPTFPLTLAGNGVQNITVQFMPTAIGTFSAMMNVNSDDSDEAIYNFVIGGKGTFDTGIKSASLSANFASLYPNPTKDEAVLTVSLKQAQHVSISIFDIQGKLVSAKVEKDLTENENQVTLNTTDLKNGVYFVEVTAGSQTNKIKMIVRH